jgi:hypothetical protein
MDLNVDRADLPAQKAHGTMEVTGYNEEVIWLSDPEA